MNNLIYSRLSQILMQHRKLERSMAVRSVNPTSKKSNKSKLKMTKGKPKSGQYKTSKPVLSKAVSQFRNKSNI